MIAFLPRQTENSFFQERIALIPKRKREAHVLFPVADTRQSVFVPAVGSGARLIVRKVLPGIAIGAVILAHRAPAALTEIRPPSFPVFPACSGFRQSNFF